MKKVSSFIIFLIVLGAVTGCAYDRQEVRADHRKVSDDNKEKRGKTLLFPIRLYQEYISPVDGDRCQMYPTCSVYCSEAIKKHGALLGWIMCSDRLMRDGRDETRLSPPVWTNGVKRSYDPLNNNDFWW
jgi:putative membrane protein insertion efficiency factor